MFDQDRRFRICSALAVASFMAPASMAFGGSPNPFTNESAVRGLTYQIQSYPQTVGYLGTGCGFADLDRDGDEDIVIIGKDTGLIGIFENDGTGHFTDHSLTSGIPTMSEPAAFSAGDYDGDGDLDLYITQLGFPNVLARNEGNFQFTNVAATAIVADAGSGQGSSWGDFDGDGWLDLYLCNYNGQVPSTANIDNKLYMNRANGTFNDVGVAQTVNDHGYGFQSVFFDMDRDGDLDLYLSNDRGHLAPLFRTNQLWRNDNGNYVNVSTTSGAGVALFSMGLACGDFDGDRYPDLYVTNIPLGGSKESTGGSGQFPLNPLLLNNGGDGTFTESSEPTGTGNPWTSWGAIFFDFDNDGPLELYVNNMWVGNKFYHHAAGFPCQEIAAPVNLQGTSYTPGGNSGVSFASSIADVDGDGDLDLLQNNLGANVQLYINNEGANANWIRYRISGLFPNYFGVGANVDTRFGVKWQYAEVLGGGNGYLGQNELTLHVGAGISTTADEVVVVWPGGSPTRTLTSMPVNNVWTLYPPSQLGDADLSGQVLLNDFLVFLDCLALGVVTPGCEMMDIDGDGDVDGTDSSLFLGTFDGPFNDCNSNGIDDLVDLLDGNSADANGTGVPDECEVLGDTNGDDVIDVDDLVNVILTWGPCSPQPALCPADVDGNAVVDVDDLVMVILNWTTG